MEEQIRALKNAGYLPLAIDSIANVSQSSGRLGHHAGSVITFDDGFENVFRLGLEILTRQKVISIQYLVVEAVGKTNHWDVAKGDVPERLMDEAQVREWLGAGQLIGSHSLSHPNLRKVSLPKAREEIFASKARLENDFGVKVRHFCYPYGSYNERLRDLVVEAGYETACTVEFGVNPAGTSLAELRRIIPLSNLELAKKAFHRLKRRTHFS